MSIWNHLLCRPPFIRMHVKCRNSVVPYLHSSVLRVVVPDERVSWGAPWPEYAPPEYESAVLTGKPWADPADVKGIRFNSNDGKVDRRSHDGDYAFDTTSGRPLNPAGRTGLRGRGVLGRWGPNHAADPLVTRRHAHDGGLQFVAIRRRDNDEWAIPGGMVDPGEQVSATLKREFGEEALGGKKAAEMDELWQKGRQLYAGYVDDPRNTDNAWMETVVMHFHDYGGVMKDVNLQAGDDAAAVRWVDVASEEPLYASHSRFIGLIRDFKE